jgi:hypothetical protein
VAAAEITRLERLGRNVEKAISLTLMKEEGTMPPLGDTTPSLTDVTESTKRKWIDSELEADLSKRSSPESSGMANKCTAHQYIIPWHHRP